MFIDLIFYFTSFGSFSWLNIGCGTSVSAVHLAKIFDSTHGGTAQKHIKASYMYWNLSSIPLMLGYYDPVDRAIA